MPIAITQEIPAIIQLVAKKNLKKHKLTSNSKPKINKTEERAIKENGLRWNLFLVEAAEKLKGCRSGHKLETLLANEAEETRCEARRIPDETPI